MALASTVAQKFKKSPNQKTHEIKYINFKKKFFGNFKNGQKSISELEKSLKLPEMQFQEKITLIYLISRGFFMDFKNQKDRRGHVSRE